MRCQPLRDLLVDICSKFNQTCYFCGAHGDNPYPLCSGCEEDLPWASQRCLHCALPLTFDSQCCTKCEVALPPFQCVEAPWTYDFPLDAAILAFKHRGNRHMGRLLADRLGAWLSYRYQQGLQRPDQLLAVPIATKRLRQRGFNQAQALADDLCARLGVPAPAGSLMRLRNTPSQQGLDLAARQGNLREAFALGAKAKVQGLHLAIVDDVMTTGATATALAKLLLEAGARRVDIYCLARTANGVVA